LKSYTTFNVEQIDGLPGRFYARAAPVQNAVERDATAEAFLKAKARTFGMAATKAFYVPSQDFIQMPQIEAFKDTAAYYGTAFHEISHWAGLESRLHRDLTGRIGSAAYSLEEIIGELAASYLCRPGS
jgi:antirestriction protein ArdC